MIKLGEIEMEAETDDEGCMYDVTLEYLVSGKYPKDATKQEKGVIRKRAKQYRVKDGQLFRVSKNKSKDEESVALVIKDMKARRQIFDGCHVGPAGNHEGRDRTQAKIAQKYFWPGITKDVKEWVRLYLC